MTYTDCKQAARDPDEEGDYMAFEQLMADAALKKDKKDAKKDKKDPAKKDETPAHHQHGIHTHKTDDSANAHPQT